MIARYSALCLVSSWCWWCCCQMWSQFFGAQILSVWSFSNLIPSTPKRWRHHVQIGWLHQKHDWVEQWATLFFGEPGWGGIVYRDFKGGHAEVFPTSPDVCSSSIEIMWHGLILDSSMGTGNPTCNRQIPLHSTCDPSKWWWWWWRRYVQTFKVQACTESFLYI